MARKKDGAFIKDPNAASKNGSRKGAGRPPEYPTKEFIDSMMNYLRLGAYLETAVIMAGVPKSTAYDWAKRGHKDRKEGTVSEYTKFLDAVERGVEEATVRDLSVIDKCANGAPMKFLTYPKGTIHPDTGEDLSGQIVWKNGKPVIESGFDPNWNAAAWRLERRKPKGWGKVEYQPEVDPSQSREEDANSIKIEFVDGNEAPKVE